MNMKAILTSSHFNLLKITDIFMTVFYNLLIYVFSPIYVYKCCFWCTNMEQI